MCLARPGAGEKIRGIIAPGDDLHFKRDVGAADGALPRIGVSMVVILRVREPERSIRAGWTP